MQHLALKEKLVPTEADTEFQGVLEQLELKSNAIAITGVGFGDEGKGRIAHELSLRIKEITNEPVAAVFKVNGGANSGHTAAGLKLNLLPTGVADKEVKHLILGRGVVADPHKVRWEAVPLDERGYNVSNRLVIDHRTMVSDFTHRLLDRGREKWMESINGEARGSTGRGISPAFQAETDQTQIFYDVFLGNKDRFVQQMDLNIRKCELRLKGEYELSDEQWNALFEELSRTEQRANAETAHHFAKDEFDFTRFQGAAPFTLNRDALIEAYWEAGQALKDSIQSASDLVASELRDKQFVVFEFGQAYLLGKRTGFPPNVTASHPYTSEIFSSAGIPLQAVHNITAAKAYDTKVGTHLFLTEIGEEHPLGRKLRKLEFGTTTGRQRMVGWYDAVEKGQTLREGGFDALVINKLDALTHSDDWQGELQICTGYRLEDGTETKRLPLQDSIRQAATPIYESYQGWDTDISEVRDFHDLPHNAQVYVAAMYYHTIDAAFSDRDSVESSELPKLDFVGVGPEPGQVIQNVPSPLELLTLLEPTVGEPAP